METLETSARSWNPEGCPSQGHQLSQPLLFGQHSLLPHPRAAAIAEQSTEAGPGLRAHSSCFSLCTSCAITAQGTGTHVICKTRSSRRLHPNSDHNLHPMEALHLCGRAFPVWLTCCAPGDSETCLSWSHTKRTQVSADSLAFPLGWHDASTGIYTATSRIWPLTSN